MSNSQNLSESANKFQDIEDNNFDNDPNNVHDIVNKYAPDSFDLGRGSANAQYQQGSKKSENFRQGPSYPANFTEERPLHYSSKGPQMKQKPFEISAETDINSYRSLKSPTSDQKAADFPYRPYSDRSSEKKFTFGHLNSDPLMKLGGDIPGVHEEFSDGENTRSNKTPTYPQGIGSIRPQTIQQGNSFARQPEASKSSAPNKKVEQYDKFTNDKGNFNKMVPNTISPIMRQNYDERHIAEDFDFNAVSDAQKKNRDEHYLTPQRNADLEQSKSSEFLEVAFETPGDWGRLRSSASHSRTQYSHSKPQPRGFSPEEAKLGDSKRQLGDVLIQDQRYSPNHRQAEQLKSGKINIEFPSSHLI